MPTQLSGYEENAEDKLSGNKEITIDVHQNKAYINASIIKNYGVNHYDVDGTTEYVGKETNQGVWLIQKIVTSGSDMTMTYATNLNNTSITGYSSAWTNRATLTYGLFSEAF